MLLANAITDITSDTQQNRLTIKDCDTPTFGKRDQPKTFQEGIHKAYGAVAREVHGAVETLIAIPVRQTEMTPSGAIREVVRALPIAILKPVAGLAEGIGYTVLGLRNMIDPNLQHDEEDVWNIL
jgi:autophagy-related protein 2